VVAGPRRSGCAGRHRVDKAHHNRVDEDAEVPGDRGPQRTQGGGQHGRGQPGLQRHLPAGREPAEQDLAIPIGAQLVADARRQVLDGQVPVDLVRLVGQRPRETEQEHPGGIAETIVSYCTQRDRLNCCDPMVATKS
jgi:hypothetical protein